MLSAGPQSSHINPALKSLHWLKIKQCIDYKILSLTYEVLTATQPSYVYNLISVHLFNPIVALVLQMS